MFTMVFRPAAVNRISLLDKYGKQRRIAVKSFKEFIVEAKSEVPHQAAYKKARSEVNDDDVVHNSPEKGHEYVHYGNYGQYEQNGKHQHEGKTHYSQLHYGMDFFHHHKLPSHEHYKNLVHSQNQHLPTSLTHKIAHYTREGDKSMGFEE